MSSRIVLRNFRPFEGTVAGTAQITFDLPVKRISISNDSSTVNLQFKFNSTETYGTLKPTETFSAEATVRDVFLSGNGAYRVWGLG